RDDLRVSEERVSGCCYGDRALNERERCEYERDEREPQRVHQCDLPLTTPKAKGELLERPAAGRKWVEMTFLAGCRQSAMVLRRQTDDGFRRYRPLRSVRLNQFPESSRKEASTPFGR